jgi:Protein of unknown function (DUF3109)
MIIIKDILVSDDLIEEQFMCNLDACKGACCWEGDWGAPVEEAEKEILDQIYKTIKPYLSKEGRKVIGEQGKYTYYEKPAEFGTPLLQNGACAYLTYDYKGVAQCGIEKAYNDGVIDFKKPISCHLYPVRVNSEEQVAFEALNYDRWDICSAACEKGKEYQMPVYQFVKDAIIRKYGQDFYDELEAAAQFVNSKK